MNEQSLCSVCLLNWVEVKYVVLASGEVELEYVFNLLFFWALLDDCIFAYSVHMCVIYLFWKRNMFKG